MVRRQKLIRRRAFRELPHCFDREPDWRERWARLRGQEPGSGDPRPLVVEIGCGVGETVLGLARRDPERDFLGVDIKSDRMWVGATAARDEGLANVAFLRIDVLRLEHYFAPRSVSAIWVTFPDPFPRKGDARQRLTHERYLRSYARVLEPGAPLHLKTDSRPLYRWTLAHLGDLGLEPEVATEDLHATDGVLPAAERDLLTRYERRWLDEGHPTNYVRVRLDPARFPEGAREDRTSAHLEDYVLEGEDPRRTDGR